MIYAENILLCITVPMLLSLLFVRGSARRFVMASIGGMIACLLAAYISGYLYLITGLTRTDVSIFLSPMVEETLKFIPPIFILLIMSPTDRNLLLIAVGIGVGFATFENCCYLLSEGASSLTLILIRGLAVGVMHTISMATLSMALSADGGRLALGPELRSVGIQPYKGIYYGCCRADLGYKYVYFHILTYY